MADKIKTTAVDATPDVEIVSAPEGVSTQAVVKGKKKFDKNTTVWCIVILVLIALVAGALLGGLNIVTYVDPDQAIMDKISSAYVVDGDIVKNSGYVVNSADVNGQVNSAFAFKSGAKEMVAYYVTGSGAYSGTIDFVFYVELASGTVDKVSVYSSSETSTIGGKVLKESNLTSLEGFKLSTLTDYGAAGSSEAKNEGYYISGATYTTKGTTNALKAVAYAYNHTAID